MSAWAAFLILLALVVLAWLLLSWLTKPYTKGEQGEAANDDLYGMRFRRKNKHNKRNRNGYYH